MRTSMLIASLSLVFASLMACSSEDTSSTGGETTPEVTQPEPEVQEEAPELFGKPLKEGVTVVDFDELVANPIAYKGATIETRGAVRASCTKRGCWMEVRSATNAASAAITVRFANYSFFVPLDSRGSNVRFQGKMNVVTLSAAEVKELEAEGGTVEKLPDGTAQAITFIATGVEMRGRKSQ